ncbi:MAG: ABC transporter substrate-binding protein [Dehalococcoidia bacterium]|nr:ABC transporter substrate-binding protein [Dehalococcoidia bacterium]
MRDRDNYWLRLRGRKLSRRRFLAGAGVAAAGSAAILAGCGDDDDDDDTGAAQPTAAATQAAAQDAEESQPDTAAEADDEPAEDTASEAAPTGPRRGGTYRTWKTTEDMGNDPAIFHSNNQEVVFQVFSHLLDFQVSKGIFSMDGATSYEQVDPTTLVWNMREGMQFHNGDPVTTEDVAFTIERPPGLLEKLGATHAPANAFDYYESIQAVDDVNIQENWIGPRADALINRSRQYFGVINKKLVLAQPEEDAQVHVNGMAAGPFMLSERGAEGVHLVRNPNYYSHPNPDDGFVEDGPYIEEYDVRIIPDAVTARSLLESGDLDAYGSVDALEAEELQGNPNVSVQAAPAGGWSVHGFDGGKWYDERARLAIFKAFNYQAFINSIHAGNAILQAPLTVINGRFQELTQEELAGYYQYDPEDARALWDAAKSDALARDPDLSKYDSIFEYVDVHTIQSDSHVAISEFTTKNLTEVLGTTFEMSTADVQTWVSAANDRTDDVKPWGLLQVGNGIGGGTDGTPGVSYLSWFDPAQYGDRAFNFRHDSPHTTIAEGSAYVGAEMVRQNETVDHEERVQIITDLQRWILDRAWGIFMMPVAAEAYLAVSNRLRDYGKDDWFNAYTGNNTPRRESAWLDEV